jgi:glycosyltransferase involved in cell wall biosynthesis
MGDAAQRLVAIAVHETSVGGASRSILRILPLLEQAGWSFACWTPGPGELREELQARGLAVAGSERLLRYHWRTLREPPGALRRLASVPGYLREFRAWVRDRDPAVLHANTLLTLPEAVSARRRRPTVLYCHETVPSGAQGAAVTGLARRAADVVVGISDASTAELRRRGLSPLIVPNGVPLPDPPPPRALPPAPLVIGTLGTVCRRKGSDLFVAAAERLQAQLPGADFRLIGPLVEGPEHAWAERVVERARRGGVSTGVAPEPYAELGEWDIAVVPSRDEPFGLVAAEAMAVGLPVVAARVGGLPDVVGTEAGVLVAPEDPEALAQAILGLARDDARRAASGRAGRARVERHFTLEAQAAGVNGAYLTALRPAYRASA